jgi:hypothetical protein
MTIDVVISHETKTLEINGVPDAVMTVALTGVQAQWLADLTLHNTDMLFAQSCLNEINKHLDNELVRTALWNSAIISYMKCFNTGIRQILPERKMYQVQALGEHDYFKALRNKNIAHDENPFNQCHPIAMVNNGTKSYKVESILAMQIEVATLEHSTFNNLMLLIRQALKWIDAEQAKSRALLTAELEAIDYAILAAMAPGQVIGSGPSEVAKPRNRFRKK